MQRKVERQGDGKGEWLLREEVVADGGRHRHDESSFIDNRCLPMIGVLLPLTRYLHGLDSKGQVLLKHVDCRCLCVREKIWIAGVYEEKRMAKV